VIVFTRSDAEAWIITAGAILGALGSAAKSYLQIPTITKAHSSAKNLSALAARRFFGRFNVVGDLTAREKPKDKALRRHSMLQPKFVAPKRGHISPDLCPI
jgi:hypothetical protein